jgi:molybdopterin-guanine dinucleotide biosynthesis protein A
MDFSGILLAGGKSRRFGPNKIKIISGDAPLIAEQVIKLGFFTSHIIISTSPDNEDYIDHIIGKITGYMQVLETPGSYVLPEIRIILDEHTAAAGSRGIGPVAGIYTGLKHSSNEYSLVIASDMPFISYRLLELLMEAAQKASGIDAVIVRNRKGIEALCGIYSKKCIKIIEKGISSGVFKISDILRDIEVRWIGPEELDKEKIDQLNFININSQKDIEEFIQIRSKGVNGNGSHNLNSRDAQKWKDFFFRGTGKRAGQEKI